MNNQPGAHILGQPFTLSDLVVPVNVRVTCNCLIASGAAGAVLTVVASAPVTCPHCGKIYLVALPMPAGVSLHVAISDPKLNEVPS